MTDSPQVLEAIAGLGTTELIIILVIVLLIFGAGKLPAIGDALGKSIRNFKKASSKQDAKTVDVTPRGIEAPEDEGATVVEVETEQADETKA